MSRWVRSRPELYGYVNLGAASRRGNLKHRHEHLLSARPIGQWPVRRHHSYKDCLAIVGCSVIASDTEHTYVQIEAAYRGLRLPYCRTGRYIFRIVKSLPDFPFSDLLNRSNPQKHFPTSNTSQQCSSPPTAPCKCSTPPQQATTASSAS
jgi:hypothetical protein